MCYHRKQYTIVSFILYENTMKKWLYCRPYINDEDRKMNGAKFKGQRENEHHTPPRSRLEKESEQYTQKLHMNLHANYEWCVGNALMQEAIEQLLRINWVALSDKFKKDLYEIINMSNEYVYKDWIYIRE